MEHYTREQVAAAGAAAWWRRGPPLEPSFVFDCGAFHIIAPSGARSVVAEDAVPMDGWEHHTSCGCALCDASRAALACRRGTARER
jgi:hypothetical protein